MFKGKISKISELSPVTCIFNMEIILCKKKILLGMEDGVKRVFFVFFVFFYSLYDCTFQVLLMVKNLPAIPGNSRDTDLMPGGLKSIGSQSRTRLSTHIWLWNCKPVSVWYKNIMNCVNTAMSSLTIWL